MLRIKAVLRGRGGYAIVVVLCIMLILAVLGTNALVAAYARIGTTAQKKVDNQAYLLATSLLTCVGDWVQQGKFDDAVQTGLLQATSNAGEAESRSVELTTEYVLPNSTTADLTLKLYLTRVQIQTYLDAAGVERQQVSGMLMVQVTALYEQTKYTFLADFTQIPSAADPLKSSWLLHSYQTNRGLEGATT